MDENYERWTGRKGKGGKDREEGRRTKRRTEGQGGGGKDKDEERRTGRRRDGQRGGEKDIDEKIRTEMRRDGQRWGEKDRQEERRTIILHRCLLFCKVILPAHGEKYLKRSGSREIPCADPTLLKGSYFLRELDGNGKILVSRWRRN